MTMRLPKVGFWTRKFFQHLFTDRPYRLANFLKLSYFSSLLYADLQHSKLKNMKETKKINK